MNIEGSSRETSVSETSLSSSSPSSLDETQSDDTLRRMTSLLSPSSETSSSSATASSASDVTLSPRPVLLDDDDDGADDNGDRQPVTSTSRPTTATTSSPTHSSALLIAVLARRHSDVRRLLTTDESTIDANVCDRLGHSAVTHLISKWPRPHTPCRHRYRHPATFSFQPDIFSQPQIDPKTVGMRVRADVDCPYFRKRCVNFERTLNLLLEKGADVDHKVFSHNGQTALHVAARFNQPTAVRVLLNHGACVDAADARGRTPLIIAAARNSVDAARILLAEGRASTEAKDASGRTALQFACFRSAEFGSGGTTGWAGIVSVGDDGGLADDGAASNEWSTALTLLSYGAEAHCWDTVTRSTPLHAAASLANSTLIDALLSRGADPDFRNSFGRTALFNLTNNSLNIRTPRAVLSLLRATPYRHLADSNGCLPKTLQPQPSPSDDSGRQFGLLTIDVGRRDSIDNDSSSSVEWLDVRRFVDLSRRYPPSLAALCVDVIRRSLKRRCRGINNDWKATAKVEFRQYLPPRLLALILDDQAFFSASMVATITRQQYRRSMSTKSGTDATSISNALVVDNFTLNHYPLTRPSPQPFE